MPNSTLGPVCDEAPEWGYYVGIIMSVFGSIGINIGQNLQAAAIAKLPEEERSMPHRSKLWRVGMGLFVGFSVINFAALALAPSSVLTPIESIQFVTNICYNRYVNKSRVSMRMLIGVTLALIGTVLSVVFGATGEGCNTIAQFEAFWIRAPWLAYFAVTLALAVLSWLVHRH